MYLSEAVFEQAVLFSDWRRCRVQLRLQQLQVHWLSTVLPQRPVASCESEEACWANLTREFDCDGPEKGKHAHIQPRASHVVLSVQAVPVATEGLFILDGQATGIVSLLEQMSLGAEVPRNLFSAALQSVQTRM